MSWFSDWTGINVDLTNNDGRGYDNGVTLNDLLTDAAKNTAPPKAPEVTDPKAEEEIEKELEIQRKARGRTATILTGGLGLTDQASVSKRVLLGA